MAQPVVYIAVVGSLNMDLIVRTPRFPAAGETITGSDFRTVPGGKGANQAVAAARQGANVAMVGRVGQDAFGETLRQTLREAGVDVQHVGTDEDAATGVALIAIDPSGENRIIIAPGANGRVSPADVDAARDAIVAADALLLQLEVPLDAVERAVAVASEAGVCVILNPAPARPLPDELLQRVDYLIPNETEAAILTGSDPARPEEAAEGLRARGVRSVIVTLGAQGALLSDESGTERIAGFPVDPVDTTAAGDAFVGTLGASLATGRSLRDALVVANAAGALATTKVGAQPSLPTRDRVEDFIARHRRNS